MDSAHRVEYAKTDAGSRIVELIPSDLFKALKKHKLGLTSLTTKT